MQKNVWIAIFVVGLVALFATSIFLSPARIFPPPLDRPRLEDFNMEQLREMSNLIALNIKGKSIIGLLNSALLIYLLIIHFQVYQATKSNFSLSLILFCLALLFYTLSANPVLTWASGFQRTNIMQAFNFLPDIFTTLASMILIYLSRQ
jgi:hypothetical protein